MANLPRAEEAARRRGHLGDAPLLIKSIKPADAAVASVRNPDAHVSFSQYGLKDLILLPMLKRYGRLEGGFYVDVGAFHPFRFSNTALLHLHKGWCGVNIDASPEAIALFNVHRPNDINILAAVSDEETELEFVTFNKGNVNSLDPGTIKDGPGPTAPSRSRSASRYERSGWTISWARSSPCRTRSTCFQWTAKGRIIASSSPTTGSVLSLRRSGRVPRSQT